MAIPPLLQAVYADIESRHAIANERVHAAAEANGVERCSTLGSIYWRLLQGGYHWNGEQQAYVPCRHM